MRLNSFLLLFLTAFLLIDLWSCSTELNRNSSEVDFSSAFWITASEDLSIPDSLRYGDHPAPLFRREFEIKDEVKSATLFITAAGYYRASINGNRIGKNYLDPAWTAFDKRIYYSSYDLTEELDKGEHCIGVTLGNGFYNSLPMKMWGNLNLRDALPSGQPRFIALLEIVYNDGTVSEIVTDDSWKWSHGPILRNNVYLGELYDAAREINAWEKVGFNDSDWNSSILSQGPGGKLQKAFFPAVQLTDTINPISIKPLEDGNYVVDMGVNFTGTFRIKLFGNNGDTISLRMGERIWEDGSVNAMTAVAGQIKSPGKGGPGAPDTAWQQHQVVIRDDQELWYQPEFSFHTFRYMEITGLNQRPELDELKGLVLNSNVENLNSFSCSSPLVNSIQEAIERTFLANMVSVQSDCAAREKFGYGGDLNATAEAFIYNFNMQDFYRKTIYDWVGAMNDTCFVDTAPYVGIKYCGLSWESAFLITQYELYLYYNDTSMVKELYDLNVEWMEKVKRIHPQGIIDKGLSDHEALEPVPVELTGTCHYLQSARIMQIFAGIMGDTDHVKEYTELEKRLLKIILDAFWKEPAIDNINKQTLFATLLYHNIIPEEEIKSASDSLVKYVLAGPSGHFTTGIFGTKYIVEALSRTGHSNLVYEILNSKAYPGWGYMIDRGATTIWETWKESDNVYSNCHPMFGSVSAWFYRWLGGIRPDPEYPGFEKFIINPSIPENLKGVKTLYRTPFGEVVSNWKKDFDNVTYEMTVPPRSIAMVKINANEAQKITILKENLAYPEANISKEENSAHFDLSPGNYKIVVGQN